jgi:hypothetical protein
MRIGLDVEDGGERQSRLVKLLTEIDHGDAIMFVSEPQSSSLCAHINSQRQDVAIDLPSNTITLLGGDVDLRTGILRQPIRTQIRILGLCLSGRSQSPMRLHRILDMIHLNIVLGLVRHLDGVEWLPVVWCAVSVNDVSKRRAPFRT